ncbi:MAG TPA: hypothetical protein VFF88_07570, partial [Methylocella sp.]|nr:hypothetical protein [Methylocella sp.]
MKLPPLALGFALTLQAAAASAQDSQEAAAQNAGQDAQGEIELPAVEVTSGSPEAAAEKGETVSAGTGKSIDMNQAASAFSVTGAQI